MVEALLQVLISYYYKERRKKVKTMVIRTLSTMDQKFGRHPSWMEQYCM